MSTHSPTVLKASYRREYSAALHKVAPEVWVLEGGGFRVGHPVNRRYTATGIAKATRFFKRGLR